MSKKGVRNNDSTDRRLPNWGIRLLTWLLPFERRDIVIGDFAECYEDRFRQKGQVSARFWLWKQVMASFPAFIQYRSRQGVGMIKSYWILTIRNLYKQAGYSSLNLVGLALGMACFVVMMIYVQNERSYDQFHEKSDRTYRLLDFRKVAGSGEESASAPIPLADALRVDYPDQIASVVRFFNFQAPTLSLAYTPASGDVLLFNERKLYFVDSEFFKVFDFKLFQGDEASALSAPNSLIITQEMAQKYFGSEDPMGKVLRFEGQHDLVVTGVFDALPSNTHLDFEFLVSFSTLENPAVLRERLRNGWIWNPAWTYLVLNEHVKPETLEAQFPDFVAKHFSESRKDRVKLYLQPLADIHLHSQLDYEMHPNSDMAYVQVFTTIAVFILLISCFNFINLTTARSTRRAREIGMRKILGGYRAQLIGQFLSESIMTCLFALVLAVPMMYGLIQLVNGFSGGDLSLVTLQEPMNLAGLIGLSVLIGLISGIYPAFFLSSYRPAQAVKGMRFVEAGKGVLFRKMLVLSQFSLSVILIVGTVIALKQLNYLQTRGLGFDQEKVLLLPTLRSPLMNQYESFKSTLTDYKDIHSMTTVEDIPGVKHQTGVYEPEGLGESKIFPRLVVHDDFATTMGIGMVAGRDFLHEFETDAEDGVIINESMVKLMDWGSPQEALGKRISNERVVGVTQDFHFASLHRPIGPFALFRVPNDPGAMSFSARYIAVRMSTQNIEETISFIQQKWFEFTPNRPFEYLFLSDMVGAQYDAEATLGKVAGVFALLSVLIACLGLFGLASYTTERRIKEIGIRKVLGAPLRQLVTMLLGSFVKLVMLAIIIGSPLAYLALDQWLSDFAYRTAIGIWPFVSSAVAALLIVLLTVGYQTIKAASMNPVSSLRHE